MLLSEVRDMQAAHQARLYFREKMLSGGLTADDLAELRGDYE